MTDPLGSSLILMDEDGNIVKRYRFDPFGNLEAQWGTEPNHYLFTGKEKDENGLYYFGARYYNPRLGRWITPEPQRLPQNLDLKNPQTLSLYTYCLNNPLKLIDPSGEKPILQSHWWYLLPGGPVYLSREAQTILYLRLTRAEEIYKTIGLVKIVNAIEKYDFKVIFWEYRAVDPYWGEAFSTFQQKRGLPAIRLSSMLMKSEYFMQLVSTYAHEVSHLMGYGETVASALSAFLKGKADLSTLRVLYTVGMLPERIQRKYEEYLEGRLSERELLEYYSKYLQEKYEIIDID